MSKRHPRFIKFAPYEDFTIRLRPTCQQKTAEGCSWQPLARSMRARLLRNGTGILTCVVGPLGRSPMTISREILLVLQPAQARRSNQGWILMADHDHRRKAGVAAEPELKRAMGGQQNGRVDNVGRCRRSISATFGHLPTRENPEMVIAAGFDFSDLIVPRSCRHHRARGARCSVPRRRRAVTGRYRKSARWHRSSRHAPQTGAGSSRL